MGASDVGSPVQEIAGDIRPGQAVLYRLTGLKRGSTLYVHVQPTSGNLDPLVMLVKPDVEPEVVREENLAGLESERSTDRNPVAAAKEALDSISLVWSDDFDGHYDAGFSFEVPEDGDYRLAVRGTLVRETAGGYKLLAGLDEPDVLSGRPVSRGDPFVFLDDSDAVAGVKGVTEATGALSSDEVLRFYNLADIAADQTLYVYVEATSGDLKPVLTLYDFSDKPLAYANYQAQDARATLQYRFESDCVNCRLRVSGKNAQAARTTGQYRLIAGINVPEVLQGHGRPSGMPVFKEPIPVQIGIQLQQITNVNQSAENFGVVATLLMKWRDPALAFNPDTVQDRFKVYTGDGFAKDMSGRAQVWPEVTIQNQQGNRWVQNRIVAVAADGRAIFLERFSTTLQAPDFNFRFFPLDRQQFYIRIHAIAPEWYYRFLPLEGYSQVGEKLGEEEWVVTGFDTSVGSAEIAQRAVSQFTFHFEAERHVTYYMFRILLPMVVLIAVSWVIFFLKDYGKRVDVAGANLLIFVAFNFTLSNDLPRLGYLTLMDTILISAFLVTALVLILSVYLRRMVTDGRVEFVNRIDRYVIMFYPLAYLAAVGIVMLLFY
ncbi:MAG: hypothetical protein U9Q81_11915 [Pseudomonadota bacterium]|nr:hypothetical protein [Pseudomonadota bacterium]